MDGDLSSVIGAQRRGSLRRAVSLAAEVKSGELRESALVTDLSEHGLWLRSERAVAVGDALEVRFELPGSLQRMAAAGRVVRVATSCGCELCGQLAGFGACFTELSETQRELLCRALRGLPPPLPRALCAAHEDALEEPTTPIIPACALMTSILSQQSAAL